MHIHCDGSKTALGQQQWETEKGESGNWSSQFQIVFFPRFYFPIYIKNIGSNLLTSAT